MESIGEYAALVSQATALNQNQFEEKAQEEQAKVEKQQSENAAIEGVIAPFGVEAIKGAGGKIFKKVVGDKLKKKIQDVQDLAKRFKEDPQAVTEELYQKYKQSATDRNPEDGGGIDDFIKRTLNGGRSNQGPPTNEEPAGQGTPNNNPQNQEDARNTNPDDQVPDTKPPAPPADQTTAPPPASQEPLDAPSAPLKNTIGREADNAGTSGEFDDIVANIARGGQSALDGVLQGGVRSVSSKLTTQLRQARVPSTVDDATLRAARDPSNIINQGTTEARAGISSKLRTGDGDPASGNILTSGEANYQNQANVDATVQANLKPKPPKPESEYQKDLNRTEGGPDVQGDEETLARTAASGAERKTFEQGVKDALEANSADLENPIGDVVEVGLGLVALFGALFGTKVHHQNVTAQVQQVNPSIGFGIRQQ